MSRSELEEGGGCSSSRITSYEREVRADVRLACPEWNVSTKLQYHEIVLSTDEAVKLTFLMIRAAARPMGRSLHRRPAAFARLLDVTALNSTYRV